MLSAFLDNQPGLSATAIVGVLTVTKTGTTARTATFPDASITVAGVNYAQSWTADQTLTDVNLILSATTGTKIGTAATQKLGFWNATPIVQPAAAGQAAAAAQTQDTLTDNSGGSASTTLAAISDTATKDAVASLAAQLAKIKADVAAVKTLEDAMRTALVNTGIMKGAA